MLRSPKSQSEATTNSVGDSKESKRIVVIGDSTLDNKVWVGRGGAILNRLKEAIGIVPASREAKIKASQSYFPPELSVLDHLQKELPHYQVLDYTNDGFTTENVLHGANKNKVFGGGFLLSYPRTHFYPLQAAENDIPAAECVILSIGGNNFREYLINSQQYYNYSQDKWVKRTTAERETYIKDKFHPVLEKMRNEYIQIVKHIRSKNPTAKIILTTQYYPSASGWVDYIYPFMKEVGKILGIGRNPNNPMDVIHEIMKQTYMQVLESAQDSNVVVADITSSLDPFDKKNHAMQIEPSGDGGKKMAQMLEYMVTQPTNSGFIYRFLPQFFSSKNKNTHVEEIPLNTWSPKHPHEFTSKACYDPKQVISLLDNEKDSKELSEDERNTIYKNEKVQQSLIALYQVDPKFVSRENFQKIVNNIHLQNSLSSAHGYLNSGRFGFWHTHGRHGRMETEKFVRSLMAVENHSEENTKALMQEWIKTSNVNNSSRAFYAFKSGLFEQKPSENYATVSSKERKNIVTMMKR